MILTKIKDRKSVPPMIIDIIVASLISVINMKMILQKMVTIDWTIIKSPILINIRIVFTSEFNLTINSPVRHLSKLTKENETIFLNRSLLISWLNPWPAFMRENPLMRLTALPTSPSNRIPAAPIKIFLVIPLPIPLSITHSISLG